MGVANTNDYKKIEDQIRKTNTTKEKNDVIKKWLQPVLAKESECNTNRQLLLFYNEGK